MHWHQRAIVFGRTRNTLYKSDELWIGINRVLCLKFLTLPPARQNEYDQPLLVKVILKDLLFPIRLFWNCGWPSVCFQVGWLCVLAGQLENLLFLFFNSCIICSLVYVTFNLYAIVFQFGLLLRVLFTTWVLFCTLAYF